MAMSKDKRLIIQENFTKLTENIGDIDSVVSNLLSSRAITDYMEEEIMAKNTKRNKIRELLTLLPKRGEVAFDRFYKALIDSEEYVAAEVLEPYVTDRSLITNRFENQVTHCDNNIEELPEVFPPDQEEEEIVVVPFSPNSVMAANYRKSLEANNNEVYKNTNGLCLIICNDIFEEETNFCDLDWEKDVEDLMSLFEKLNFSVNIIKNYKIEGLRKRLDKIKQKEVKDIDCLVVFVLTYGEKGNIYGSDGNNMTIQSIIDYFYPTSCPVLSTKPKLFFIQTVPLEQNMDTTDGAPQQNEISIKKAVEEMKIGQSEKLDSEAEPRNVSSRGDTYICVSATDKGPRDVSGSLFVKALIYAYKRFSCSIELGNLTLKMNALINKGEMKYRRQRSIGSYVRSSLAKSFYFFPRNSP